MDNTSIYLILLFCFLLLFIIGIIWVAALFLMKTDSQIRFSAVSGMFKITTIFILFTPMGWGILRIPVSETYVFILLILTLILCAYAGCIIGCNLFVKLFSNKLGQVGARNICKQKGAQVY